MVCDFFKALVSSFQGNLVWKCHRTSTYDLRGWIGWFCGLRPSYIWRLQSKVMDLNVKCDICHVQLVTAVRFPVFPSEKTPWWCAQCRSDKNSVQSTGFLGRLVTLVTVKFSSVAHNHTQRLFNVFYKNRTKTLITCISHKNKCEASLCGCYKISVWRNYIDFNVKRMFLLKKTKTHRRFKPVIFYRCTTRGHETTCSY